MKIGILTFHRAENFGAVLQAYALQSFLLQEGYDVRIIDYRNAAIERSYHIFNPSILWSRKNLLISLQTYLLRFLHIQEKQLRKRKYEDFRRQYLRLTSPVSNIQKPLDFDCYITGSDQVWNLHLTGGLDSVYFLGFPMYAHSIKISYAASSDNDPNGLIKTHGAKLRNLLNTFHAISVRETFLKQELQPYVQFPIQVCLDPTFLLSREAYLKMAIKPVETRYILVYHMTPVRMGTGLAHSIAAGSGREVLEIYIYGGYTSHTHSKKGLGPLELLGYIAYADKVITTSFHGLSLSLILHKDVWVVNKGDNLRQRHLLETLGLSHRLLNTCKDYNSSEIDYRIIDVRLSELIQSSKSFLKMSLS